jgi:acid stress chaperone HdeB
VNIKVIYAAAVFAVASAIPAKAQVVLDMSLITCKQFMESPSDRKELIASWMGGYFSASKNLYMLDFRYVERNQKVVGAYCKTHKGETLMSAIQKNAR